MIRRLVAALAFAVLPWPSLAHAADTHVRPHVAVSGEFVRIGDLVDQPGDKAQVALFRAPELGRSGTIQMHRVVEALRAHGIEPATTRAVPEVVVVREARIVPLADIEAVIAEGLARQISGGSAERFTLTLEGSTRALEADQAATGSPQVERMSFDPRSGRFEALVAPPALPGQRRVAQRFVGTAVETVDVPVLQRALTRGETVRLSDVAIERRPRADVASDMMTQARDIVGQAARRALRPGQPLRSADLMKPDLVARNETVTIVYEMPGIVLTVRGRAVEAGGEGDTVSVVNLQSRRTVQGTVIAQGRIRVGSAPARVADISTTGSITTNR
jgi:flagella basal body P-ring formation protein FlgA